MSPFIGARWQVVSPYLDQAIEMDGNERAAWLESLRAGDPALAADLQMLLEDRDALHAAGFLESGAPPLTEPAPPVLAGQTVGGYELVSLIGQGGMGSVWLARRSDGRFEGLAAVKFLNAALIGRGDKRFKREGSILARLTHAHIARLIDAGVSSMGQPYLVLEHVEGEHIDRYCDQKALGIEARIRLFLDVLAAVAHAHANLIVHRDIKPSNVLVGANGALKLLDFGIAKLIEGDAQVAEATVLTREGGWALTPEYAAPEQVTAGPITTATDVYSLGVLLYVLLTGRQPAGTSLQSPAEIVKAILEKEPQRLSDAVVEPGGQTSDAVIRNAAQRATTPEKLRRLLQGDLETIVSKTLKKSPQERYGSVTALADDLRRHLAHEPISARSDTLAYRAAKFVARHKRSVAAAAAVTVALAGLVGFYTAQLTAERDRAHLEAEKAAKVAELLTGLLTGADPYRTPDAREPTVQGLLDAGAERVQKELAGQPELQAEMLTVIGRVYQRLGAPDRARPLLEQALALGRRVLGPEHVRVAQSLNDLGVLLREKGDLAAAQPLLEEALETRRRLLGREHKDVAVTLVEVGRLYKDQGFSERAEPLFQESLKIRRTVLGEEDRETAVSLSELALLLWQKGDFSGAEPLFRRSLAISRKTLGEDHPNVAISTANLALVVSGKGDYAAAESLFRQALAIHRKTPGDNSRHIATTLNNLSHPLREQGKYDEAASALSEALQIARPTLGNDHPLVVTYTVNLARVHLARGEAATAAPLLRQALETRQRLYREGDWRIGSTKSLLGASLTALKRYEEAEPLLLDAHRVLKASAGPGRDAAATVDHLVALYDAWGQPEKAAPYRALVRKK